MYVKTNSGDYWVECHGTGKPIVFFHGFTGSAQTWLPLLSFFKNNECILIDLPGHGQTKALVESMEDCCCDLYSILEQLDIDKVDVIGYSMGGRTALSFACYYPELIRTLTLESASPGLMNEKERQERKEKDQQLIDFILSHPLESFIDKWENIPLFESQKQLSAQKRSAIREERLHQNRNGLAASLQAMGTGVMPSWWNQLSILNFPVLLIAGEWDHKFVSISKKMNDYLPNSRIEVISEAGHAIHVEQLKKFGTIVEEFINQRRSSYDNRVGK